MMRQLNWNLMSWWQQTVTVAVIGTIAGGFLSLLAIWLWVNFDETRRIAVWYTLSVFPLLVVVLIGFVAKIQERVEMRGGVSHIRRRDNT